MTACFHVHLVSDSTGETLEALVSAALVQFEGVLVKRHFWPLVKTPVQMKRLMEDISKQSGLVMYTLVDQEIRSVLVEACQMEGLPTLAILDPVINILGTFFGREPSHLPGRQHLMDQEYFKRIDALHFTMAHDDGQLTEGLSKADIILVGVSRTSKTPTSIYLANKGFKTANVPFVPGCPLPEILGKMTNSFVIGLTTSPERLSQIRANRLKSLNEGWGSLNKGTETSYANIEKIQDEIRECKRYCRARNWPIIDVTRRSIEESAAAILSKYQYWRQQRLEITQDSSA